MDEGLGWMVEEMGREELFEEVQRLKVMVIFLGSTLLSFVPHFLHPFTGG